MRIGLTLGTILLTLFLITSTAQAGSGCQQDASSMATHIFDASDADGDGTLTAEEYTGAGLERYGVAFEAFDANEDGETSRQEYIDHFEMHHPPEGALNI